MMSALLKGNVPSRSKEVDGMNTVTLTLPPQIFQRLQERAKRIGQSPEAVARDLLVERLMPPADEPARLDEVIQTMYAEGDLVAMNPNLVRWADDLRHSLGTEAELQELRREMEETVLDPPLSKVILEMRGPKG
jgi:plasmid stability protein